MKNPLKTRAGKFATVAGIAGALTIAGTAVANAHPGNDHRHTPGETSAGAPGMVDLSTLNGCDTSTTKKLTVTIPKEINEVRVRSNAAYDVNKVTEPLANPITGEHGKTITERVAKIEFTPKSNTSNDKHSAPHFGVKTPEDAAGKTLYFPTVQTCENGETAWTDTPKDGEQAAHPAPKLKVTEKKADDKRPDLPANGAPEGSDHRPGAKDGSEQGPDGKDGQREGGRGHKHGGPRGDHKPGEAPDNKAPNLDPQQDHRPDAEPDDEPHGPDSEQNNTDHGNHKKGAPNKNNENGNKTDKKSGQEQSNQPS